MTATALPGFTSHAMPAATCPACGEDRLVEFDPVLKRWFCLVCATRWRPFGGRWVTRCS
jgi:hypothetical protein